MLLAAVGDTHAHLKTMWAYMEAWQKRTDHKIDWIWQVGDFGIWPDPNGIDKATRRNFVRERFDPTRDFTDCLLGDYEIPIPTYFTRGNHEDQGFLRIHEKQHMHLNPDDFHTKPIELCPNLFYVPDGYVIELDGVKFASWGGNFGKKVWERNIPYWPHEGNKEHARFRSGRYLNHMTQDIFETLMRADFDVLVTHDAPTGTSMSVRSVPDSIPKDETSPQGREGVPAIRTLIEEKQPLYQINGHWHTYARSDFRKTKAIVLDRFHPSETESRRFVEFIEF